MSTNNTKNNLLPSTLFLLIIFALLHSFHCFEKSEKNEKIETEVRKAFQKHKTFVDKPMRNDELLCKCNHVGCSQEVTDIAGDKYSGVCRAHRGGSCRRQIHMTPSGKIKEVVLSCVHRDQLIPVDRPFICQNVTANHFIQIVRCCKDDSFCNEPPLPIESGLVTGKDGEGNVGTSIHWYVLLLAAVAVIFSAFGLCVGIFYCNADQVKSTFSRCWGRILQIRNISIRQTRLRHSSRLDKLLDDLERTVSTGSGAGMPMLAQRTIARQITLKECIGRGRFGEVYMGDWRGERVAVKIFLSRDETSWQRETEIYRHNMIRHSNLLRWIASDNKDTGTSTQLWLVTEYLPNGALYDFLEQEKITLTQAVQFIRSIAHGLAYLHTEVPGVTNQCYKPAIAHRDMKSKNILIKNDWTCCIADLGMAIRYTNGDIDMPSQDRGGTVRYLAPEFLGNTYNRESFTAYLQMDIYAFAMVIWEISRRADSPQEGVSALPYEIPYQEFVPREPTPDEMRQCVFVERRRPSVPASWGQSKAMAEIARIVQESWTMTPNSRLTALNIRCSLDRICEEYNLNIVT